MDILYEILDLPNQESRKKYLESKLDRSMGHFDFIKRVYIKLSKTASATTVSIRTKPERGKTLFVSHSDPSERKAIKGAIAKMMGSIQKYRENHYHSVHKTAKRSFEKKINDANLHES